MQHIQGTDREQLTFFPEALDEYIARDHPVRFLDVFIDSLDLKSLGFEHVVLKETGRPPYPADLLKLYVYGYLNRIRSSRRLETESGRNLELMWLPKRLTPDFKTIADFRRDNRRAIRQVCREFTLFCRQLDLFGGELVAIDGSKFRAQDSKGRNFIQHKLKRQLQGLDQKIDEYLEELDEADQEEQDVHKPSAEELREKIEAMKGRRARLREMQDQLKESVQSQISLTDPDSRAMPIGGGEATLVGYNVQPSVDAKHKLIVDHDVTDLGLLGRMAQRAKQALGVDELDVVADRGYYDGQQAKECLENGITPYIPKASTSANRKRGLFTKQDFRYDPEQDSYRCPAGEALSFRFQTTELGRDIRYYATPACRGCALRAQCTSNQGGRRITRWVDEHLLEAMRARVQAEPEKVGLRKQLVEHPFGTIKHSWTQGYFLMRGVEKVRAEMALTVLAHNLMGAIEILGVTRLVAALA